jgi:hypothetical protein
MKPNGARPEVDLEVDVRLRCKDLAGVIERNEDGIPVVFRRRCKNQQCCPRMAGFMAIHRWVIYGAIKDNHGIPRGVGEYVTEYVPDRSPSEILGRGARTNGTGNPRRASV